MANNNLTIKVQLDPGAFMPTKAHDTDAGFDLYLKNDVILNVGIYKLISTGVHFAIPAGWEGQIRPRSSSCIRYIDVAFGTIDAGYTGAVGIYVKYMPSDYYLSKHGSPLLLKKGERIAQIVFNKVPNVSLELGDVIGLQTERGANGFGSSGV